MCFDSKPNNKPSTLLLFRLSMTTIRCGRDFFSALAVWRSATHTAVVCRVVVVVEGLD